VHDAPDGLGCVDVESATGTARVYFHGAHLSAWHPAHASVPVLWLSRESRFQADRPIRGGVPICYPWFGPHPSDRSAPAHGFVRLAEWTLEQAMESEDGVVTLAFSLDGDEHSSPAWPHAFRIAHRITIGTELMMALEVSNRGRKPFRFEEALHTYFSVSNIEEVSVSGLERVSYLDKVEGGAQKEPAGTRVRFTGETDRVYLDTVETCIIEDPGMGRRIRIAKSGSRSTVVWNPWIVKAGALPDFGDDEWRGMLCVETANIGHEAVGLEPGRTHVMTATIAMEPI
jgi:glucose-6-phosphate 1-epimerase